MGCCKSKPEYEGEELETPEGEQESPTNNEAKEFYDNHIKDTKTQLRANKRYDIILNGTVVSLKDLVEHPERNGDYGKIVEYDENRYTVKLTEPYELLKVKPMNLQQHVHVTLQKLVVNPHLNGQRGAIFSFNKLRDRYHVYVVKEKKIYSVKPNNVVLDKGTTGRLVNLKSKPAFNNKYGTIDNWIRSSNRYDVLLSPNTKIRIKIENIRV